MIQWLKTPKTCNRVRQQLKSLLCWKPGSQSKWSSLLYYELTWALILSQKRKELGGIMEAVDLIISKNLTMISLICSSNINYVGDNIKSSELIIIKEPQYMRIYWAVMTHCRSPFVGLVVQILAIVYAYLLQSCKEENIFTNMMVMWEVGPSAFNMKHNHMD